jgi:outer membrane protein assembly factor BamB
MFGHDPQHTGRSLYSGPAASPNLKWVFTPTTYDISLSDPAIGPYGTIYVVGIGYVPGSGYSHTDSNLYAINPNGSLQWTYNTGQRASSPAIGVDGTIYVCTSDGKLDAINPNGSLKWVCSAGGGGSPVVDGDGTIYVGSYAINPDGSLKWIFNAEGNFDYYLYHLPAIGADGTVYRVSDNGGLYAINPGGSLKWSYNHNKEGEYCELSPAIGADGTIYVITLRYGESGVGTRDTYVNAISPDGSLKWISRVSHYGYAESVAIGADGTIYVSEGPPSDGRLYAMNPDGSLKWTYTGEEYICTDALIGADGTIYVGANWGQNGWLFAINPDGSLKWSYKEESATCGLMAAIGADGTLYVRSRGGKLSAFGGK